MVSSDEDGEIIMPECVTNYWLFDQNDEPSSITCLPLLWLGDKFSQVGQQQIFLRGTGDDGQEIYKQVIAWTFELSYAQPEISLLSKDKKWIQLKNPKKSFEVIIRSGLIMVHALHYLKKNHKSSGDQLWSHLKNHFRLYESEPSLNDLVAHFPLIRNATKKDMQLANSEYLLSIMDEDMHEPKDFYKNTQPAKKSKFIDDGDGTDSDEEQFNLEDEPLFDTVCALCDNGGTIVPCEGICMRSFHATKDLEGTEFCETLGFTSQVQVEAVPILQCENCRYKKHQCFSCGRLGSSDKSCEVEVFSCVSGTCGHFYHPACVAKLLHPVDQSQSEELQKKIIAGEPFICPVHKCLVCHQSEDKTVPDLQLAVCRRCPKAYHRKCLPREISFESDDGSPQRAWDNLLPHRILIYCMDHIIDPDLGTPARDHIVFPRPSVGGKTMNKSLPSIRKKLPAKWMKGTASERSRTEITAARMPKTMEITRRTSSISSKRPSSQLTNLRPYSQKRKHAAPEDRDMHQDRHYSSEDPEIKNKILRLIKQSNDSFNADEYVRKQKAISHHAMLDRSITLGKIEHSVKAVRAALKKLDHGGTIEEAKEICEPGILRQLFVWRNKLRVYMAPFIHGGRYTSFGRHFTKSDKLKQVVDRLQWYVQTDDTIVDFCCGSNEFSILMKEKLDMMGKQCFFKNYDLFPPQNTFCFEMRDWMSIELDELPSGDKLIMGLNPPFGVNASLANKFIRKALTFKPKLLILIVPDETDRLDRGPNPYDLIWRDKMLLQGKAFYLPGSSDINNQVVEDWNNQPPSLYLWSRPNWTSRHKALAEEYKHLVINMCRRDHQLDTMEPTIHATDDMRVDMEISSPEQLPRSGIPQAHWQPEYPAHPFGGTQPMQGFQHIEQPPIFPSMPSPVYSPYRYFPPPPPPPYLYPPYSPRFTLMNYGQHLPPYSPSTSYQSSSPYDPFSVPMPATDPIITPFHVTDDPFTPPLHATEPFTPPLPSTEPFTPPLPADDPE